MLHRSVCDEGHPPDVAEGDEHVGAQPVEVAQQDVGTHRVPADAVKGRALPGPAGSSRAPAQNVNVVTQSAKAVACKARHVPEAGRDRRGIRDPEYSHGFKVLRVDEFRPTGGLRIPTTVVKEATAVVSSLRSHPELELERGGPDPALERSFERPRARKPCCAGDMRD